LIEGQSGETATLDDKACERQPFAPVSIANALEPDIGDLL
jgi:hypothetical protein